MGIGISSLFVNLIRIVFLATNSDFQEGAFFFFISSGIILLAIAVLSFFAVLQLNSKEIEEKKLSNLKVQENEASLLYSVKKPVSTQERFKAAFKENYPEALCMCFVFW